MSDTGFGSIGDEFDGVDKVLARGEQGAEAIRLGQIFDGDVVGRLLSQRFEPSARARISPGMYAKSI